MTSNSFLDPDVGAVAVGFDREFSYDKLLRATTYLANPECLFLATNPDEKVAIPGSRHHFPGFLKFNLYFTNFPTTQMNNLILTKFPGNFSLHIMQSKTIHTQVNSHLQNISNGVNVCPPNV